MLILVAAQLLLEVQTPSVDFNQHRQKQSIIIHVLSCCKDLPIYHSIRNVICMSFTQLSLLFCIYLFFVHFILVSCSSSLLKIFLVLIQKHYFLVCNQQNVLHRRF